MVKKLKNFSVCLINSGVAFIKAGFEEIILPSLWSGQTFVEKAGGSDILEQMYLLKDRGERDVCLIPEATGIIQELFRDNFFKQSSNPDYTRKLFYVARCYRYEASPQKGRQREFTQLGVEIVTTKESLKMQYKQECMDLLKNILDSEGTVYDFCPTVKRGLSYYVEDGFEVECDYMGSQKQIAGGGLYKEGVGFAIGLDRWKIALDDMKSLAKKK